MVKELKGRLNYHMACNECDIKLIGKRVSILEDTVSRPIYTLAVDNSKEKTLWQRLLKIFS